MLALMRPVITLTDGRCVAITRWMPTARAIWAMRADRLLDVAGRDHHQVGQLVDHDQDERQRGGQLGAVAPRSPRSLAGVALPRLGRTAAL